VVTFAIVNYQVIMHYVINCIQKILTSFRNISYSSGMKLPLNRSTYSSSVIAISLNRRRMNYLFLMIISYFCDNAYHD